MLPQKKSMHKIIQTVFAGPYYIQKDYKNFSKIKKLQKKKKKEICHEEGFLILFIDTTF